MRLPFLQVADEGWTAARVLGSILGINRHGRDLETRQEMLRQLSQIWTRNSGQSEAHLWISVTEVDHTNVMDAGLLIPEPGHEHEWLEENGARLAELGIAV